MVNLIMVLNIKLEKQFSFSFTICAFNFPFIVLPLERAKIDMFLLFDGRLLLSFSKPQSSACSLHSLLCQAFRFQFALISPGLRLT